MAPPGTMAFDGRIHHRVRFAATRAELEAVFIAKGVELAGRLGRWQRSVCKGEGGGYNDRKSF